MTIEQQLQALEEKMLDSKTRTSYAAMTQLLADDFREFGASGREWTKAEMLRTLPTEVEISEFEIDNLTVMPLGGQHALVTYKLTVQRSSRPRTTLRSSVWKNHERDWQMVFHQGTLRQ